MMNICIPLAKLNKVKEAQKLVDFVELRLDLYKKYDLKKILSKIKKKTIVTNRPKREFGCFDGSEINRVKPLKDAIELGADYIDVENSTDKKILKELIKNKQKTKIILSNHLKKSITLSELKKIYKNMSKTKGVDIIKIVFPAKHRSDVATILQFLKYQNKYKGKPLIAFCSGEKGISSRVFSPIFGGYMTYASFEKGGETSKGQIPILDLIKIYSYLKVAI